MVKLWFKVICDNRITTQTVYEKIEPFDYSEFFDYISKGCEKLDLSTPVIIKRHIINFAKYNSVRFVKSDFVEIVPFDRLEIENLDR